MATPSLLPGRRKKIDRGQILINGEWRDARDGVAMTTFDPTTGRSDCGFWNACGWLTGGVDHAVANLASRQFESLVDVELC